jgi:hypothetical protein
MSIDPLPPPQAWSPEEMRRNRSRWAWELGSDDLACIDAALQAAVERGLQIPFDASAFPLGAFARKLDVMRHELEQGTGVAFIRGLDVQRWGIERTKLVYWGLGAHLGDALAQTPRGDLLVNVRNEGGDPYKDPTQRGYHTSQYLPFHNDQGDMVGLLCLRPSKEGGLSCICSAGAIHNEILRTRPDLAQVMYGPFHADVRGEQPPGRKPYYEEPRFAVFNGRFYAQHGPTYVKSAQRFAEVPRLTPAQLEAMDRVDTLAADNRFRLDMDFREGDVQFLNNHLVFHSRTGFVDFDEPDRKRHLLRLWLCTPHYREVPPFFKPRYEDMAHWLAHPA